MVGERPRFRVGARVALREWVGGEERPGKAGRLLRFVLADEEGDRIDTDTGTEPAWVIEPDIPNPDPYGWWEYERHLMLLEATDG